MPKVFGLEHILYILLSTTVMIGSLIYIKCCKNEKAKQLAIIISASLLLVFITFNRISIAAVNKRWLDLIPPTVCGVTSLLFPVFVLTIKKPCFARLPYGQSCGTARAVKLQKQFLAF